MLSPAIKPATAVIAKRSVTLGQRQLTHQVSTAPSAIMPDTDAGNTKARPSAAALGSQRACPLPTLDDALARCLAAGACDLLDAA